MANEDRNQHWYRTTGSDWRENSGYSDQPHRNEGYDDNRGSRGYSKASYRPENMSGNRRDRGAYSSDYGYQQRPGHEGVGFNSPHYGEDHMHPDSDFWDRGRRDFWDKATDEMASWFGDSEAAHRRRVDHRGKGPKGYKRSDERIREDINDRLSDDPYVDASGLEVTVSDSEVVIAGQIRDRKDKRRIEDIIERVSGVTHVENRVRVAPGETSEYKYPTATTTGGSVDTNSKAETTRSKQPPKTS